MAEPPADALTGPRPDGDGIETSITYRWFTDSAAREIFPREEWARHSAAHVADLRATSARRGGDGDVAALIRALGDASAEFRELWARHDVVVRRFDRKTFLVPQVGELQLTCEAVLTTDADLRLRAFFPTEGTDAREKLELLGIIAAQQLVAGPR